MKLKILAYWLEWGSNDTDDLLLDPFVWTVLSCVSVDAGAIKSLRFPQCESVVGFHFRGKKKLEKALFQSQQDVMHLTEKLVDVQSGIYSGTIFFVNVVICLQI